MAAVALREVEERISAAAERAGRSPSEVTLVVVTKDRSNEEVLAAYEAGQRDLGENRAQELASRLPALPDDVRWHFVGSLQRRKVRVVRPVIALLHSLDRVELAEAWLKGPGIPPPALLQINVAEEPQKHGFAPGEANRAAESVLRLGVPLIGLMAIPPQPEHQEDSRPWFSELRHLRDQMAGSWPQVAELSMGMTDDYEVAVEEGATIVRVGRAIFGDEPAG